MNKTVKISLISAVVLSVAFSFSSLKLVKGDTLDCSHPELFLDGHILADGSQGGGALAIVTNNSDCGVNVGLDAYRTSDNSTYDSQGAGLPARQTVELHISVPDCQYRLELSSGSTILESHTIGSHMCGGPTPTPTHTPTPTPTHPTPTPTPVQPLNCVANQDQVFINQPASFYITNPGIGAASWSAPGGNPSSGNGLSFTTSFATTGMKDITVSETYHSAVCHVNVMTIQTPPPTPTPTPTSTPTPTATPTPTPTFTPTPPPVCVSGTVYVNSTGSNTAYTIYGPNGLFYGYGTQIFTNQVPGTYTIYVNNYNSTLNSPATATLYCNSSISFNIINNIIYYPTPTPYFTPNPIIIPTNISITKTGRNISRGDTVQQTSLTARRGDGIEFMITVTAPTNTNLTNVMVTDALPAGMNYTAQSTTVNNTATGDGITAGGLNIGTIYAGQQSTITFYATVNSGVSVGQVLTNTATARADNVNPVTSQPVQIQIVASSVIGPALHVRTGPGTDATAFSGLGALLISGLYYGRRKMFSFLA